MEKWLLIICAAVLVCMAKCLSDARRGEVQAWCVSRGYSISNCEYRTLRTGPFWVTKDIAVYRVEASKSDGKLYILWFRFLFGMKVKEELAPETYIDLQ